MEPRENSLLRNPSEFLPVVMSLTALAMVMGHIVLFGVEREADEGTAAHIYHVLIAGQAPIIAFFAVKWLPRDIKRSLVVLAVQIAAALAALAPVCWFGL